MSIAYQKHARGFIDSADFAFYGWPGLGG